MLCRKRLNRHQNQADLAVWDEVQQEPVYGLDDDRQIGGASLAQAFMKRGGWCEPTVALPGWTGKLWRCSRRI
jgi:hypothetical protein